MAVPNTQTHVYRDGSGWYSLTDYSGPYSWDGTTMVLMSPGGAAAPATVADGSDVNSGTTTDAAVAAGAAGTMSAKTRRLTADLGALVAQLAPPTPWAYAAATNGISNTTTAVTVKAAAGGALVNYLSAMQLSSDPLGAASEFAVRDGAGGAVLWRMKIGTAGIVNGLQILFNPPLRGTANTLLEVVTLTASITGGVYVNAQGYAA